MTNRQSVLFPGLADKPVSVEFTEPATSSDGGLILLAGIDRHLRLTERMAAAIDDPRQPSKVEHPMLDLVRERVYAIACGYPDGADAARLRGDPVLKLACERRAIEGDPLASQPTLSRFENAPTPKDLLHMAYALTDTVIEDQKRRRRGRRVDRITIDMDPTDDPTYGEQQLTFFNAYYDTWCYLPMVTSIQFEEEAEQWLVAPLLRPGNASGTVGAITVLRRLLPRLRAAFPKARVLVRLDGAFATPEVFDWLEQQGLDYLVNMAKNTVLKPMAEPWMKGVRIEAKKSGKTEHVFGEVEYKAGKWDHARRVIVKAEVTMEEGKPPRDNPRFVVTNLRWAPKTCYRRYTARGDVENRLKELHHGLRFDLTSCTEFHANQFRNLLTAAAYVLYQHLRSHARGTDCERAQVETLRGRLVKIGVTVIESVRRIVFKGPLWFPWFTTWRRIAWACGAASG